MPYESSDDTDQMLGKTVLVVIFVAGFLVGSAVGLLFAKYFMDPSEPVTASCQIPVKYLGKALCMPGGGYAIVGE